MFYKIRFLLSILVVCAAVVNGEMLQYTFTGVIDEAYYMEYDHDIETDQYLRYVFNTSDILGSHKGDPLTYVFNVDTERQGFYRTFSREIVPVTSEVITDAYDDVETISYLTYFFAEMVEGIVLPDIRDGGDSYYSLGAFKEYETKVSGEITEEGKRIVLTGGKIGSVVQVYNEAESFDEWLVGSIMDLNVASYETVVSGNIEKSKMARFTSNLELVSIVRVPEPSMEILLLSGIGIFFIVSLVCRRRVS